MVRWEPGTRERLLSAAMELYVSQGYEKTTAAEIAAAVGLTERTFFRHFTDKREVLFHGQERLVHEFVQGVANAPEGATPLELIEAALAQAARFFPDEMRPHSAQRQTVITANPALQERELLKMAGLATAVTAALQQRGVEASTARLAAESGITVFGVTFGEWIAEGESRSFAQISRDVLAQLVALVQLPSHTSQRENSAAALP